MSPFAAEVKKATNLLDLAREHGILLNGENKALCPFHKEQQPSFHLHTDGEEQYFHCFGCGAGGDAIQFVKLMQRLSFKESLSFLAKRAGIPMDESKLDAAVEHDRCLSDVLAATAGFYQSCLTSDARQYLHDGRGFSDDIIRDFQIGFARGGLREHLAQHYPEDLCLEAGVLKKHDNGMARDFLYNRIVFPHLFRGRVVNLTGRAMGNASGPKYLHLPGKQRHLFNEDDIVKGKKEVFLTEGIPDCLSMIQLGYPAIAVLGAGGFHQDHVPKFAACEKVFVVFDTDEAGSRGARRVGEFLGNKARIVSLSPGADGVKRDLNDYLKDDAVDALRAAIRAAQTPVKYEISIIPADTERTDLPQALGSVLHKIAIMNPAEAEHHIELIGERFDLSEKAVAAYRKTIREYKKNLQSSAQPPPCSTDVHSDFLFPEIAPWSEPIDPNVVLMGVKALLGSSVICGKSELTAATLWVAMTWFMNQVGVAPLLVITSPEKRCGKTTLLSILNKLAANSIVASNISPAAFFRSIQAWHPTLLVDEADSFLRFNDELRGILNSGHTRDTAFVIRTVGDDHKPQSFNTWGAKAIACIGKLQDTLMDRAVEIRLERKSVTTKVDSLRGIDPQIFGNLKAQLARFALDYKNQVHDVRQQAIHELPSGLDDRAKDNWEPLFQIALVAGEEWLSMAKVAAIELSGDKDINQTIGVQLLADIRDVFDQRGMNKISTGDLIAALCGDEEKPWATYNSGQQITSRQLANKLKSYGIQSNTIRSGDGTAKGYKWESFDDTFFRYLPPILSVTTSQVAPSKDLQVLLSVTCDG